MDDVKEIVVKQFVVLQHSSELILVIGCFNLGVQLVSQMIIDWLAINVNREIKVCGVCGSSSKVCVLGLYLRDSGHDGVVDLVMRYSGQQLIGAHRIRISRSYKKRYSNDWVTNWVIRRGVAVIIDGTSFNDIDIVIMGKFE